MENTPSFRKFLILIPLFLVQSLLGCTPTILTLTKEIQALPFENRYLSPMRQLTWGGINSQARWSFTNQEIAFQHQDLQYPKEEPEYLISCSKIFLLHLSDMRIRQISPNDRDSQFAAFFPKSPMVIFSSSSPTPEPCHKEDPLFQEILREKIRYKNLQFFSAHVNSEDLVLSEAGGPSAYNSEINICKDGTMIFTSNREGNFQLYLATLNLFGSIVSSKAITTGPGYRGEVQFSPDCKRITWRSFTPDSPRSLQKYENGLQKNQVELLQSQIWTSLVDGTHAHPVTRLKGTSLSPTFTPDGNSILFASNFEDSHFKKFSLYLTSFEQREPVRITSLEFNTLFPTFSPNGKYLSFSSNREARSPNELNLFVSEWNKN